MRDAHQGRTEHVPYAQRNDSTLTRQKNPPPPPGPLSLQVPCSQALIVNLGIRMGTAGWCKYKKMKNKKMRAFDLLLQVAWCGVEKKYQDTSSRPDTEIENWELEPRQKEWSWTSTRGVPGSSSGSRSEDGVSTNNSIRRISGAQRKIWKDRKKKRRDHHFRGISICFVSPGLPSPLLQEARQTHPTTGLG